MGHRTDAMYRTAEQFKDAPPKPHHGLISGRGWKFEPGEDPCYTKELPEGARRPKDAHSCVTVNGKMVCFIFLALAVIFTAGVILGYIPLSELAWVGFAVC